MSEESTPPDLGELVRGAFEAASRGDIDALMAFYAPDAVTDGTRTIGGTWRGRAAIRGLAEDWRGAYEDVEWVPDELVDLGNGVVFTVVSQKGKPVGVGGHVQQREGWVSAWVDGLIASLTYYPEAELDEARAAAERLAEEQADVDLRRGYEALSAGHLDEALLLLTHDAVVDMTRTVGVAVHGRAAFHAFQEDWSAGYEEVTYTPEEIVDFGNGVTFVRVLQTARPKGTAGQVTQREPNIFISEDGSVVRIIIYPESDLDEARAAAERLAEERG